MATDEGAPDEPARGRKPLLLILGIVVVVAAAVLTVLISTGGGSDDPATAAPSKPPPTLEPLRLGDKPLWTSEETVYADVSHVEVRDEVLLFHHGDSNLTLVDAATGKPRWTIDKLQELAGGDGAQWLRTFGGGQGVHRLVGRGDDAAVLVEYHYWADCTHPPGHPGGRGVCHGSPSDETGLALVSGQDGSVVWKTPTIPSYPAEVDYDTRPEQVLRVVDDRVALVSITAGAPTSPGYDLGPQRTIAIDMRTGATLWEQSDGGWPSLIVGDTVLSQVSKGLPGSGLSDELPEGTVVASDLATGQRQWDLSGRFARSRLVLTAGDVALVTGVTERAPAEPSVVVLAAGTGRELAGFDDGEHLRSCESDGRSLIACAVRETQTTGDYEIATFQVDDRTIRPTATGRAAVAAVHAVWAERIEVSSRTPDGQESRSYTLDSAGNTIDENLPGDFVGISGNRAVFLAGAGTGGDVTALVYRMS